MLRWSLRKRGGGSDRGVVGVEVSLMFPHSPTNSRQFIGQRAGRFVMTGALFKCDGPLVETGYSFSCALKGLGAVEHRACAMDEQGSEVDVAHLGNPSEASSIA